MVKLATNDNIDDIQLRYRDNFARHLMGVSLYLQSETMRTLIEECGHRGLRINFEPYITIIGERGARLSDIAERLKISRQAANQTANTIEAAGYIARQPDPEDGRAKLLVATERGHALRLDGAREAAKLQRQMQKIVGSGAISRAIDTLSRLNERLGLALPPPGDTGYVREAALGGLLPRLSDYTSQRLMMLTAAKGHPDLKLSFAQVLTTIGPDGGRIQQMAELHGVTKQAISAIATELEDLGYIHRVPDPADARQVLLHFTGSGRHLIADSVASVDTLEMEFEDLAGKRAIAGLANTLKALYNALHLEQDVFGKSGPLDIRALAGQLRAQLGEQGARTLAEILLTPGKA
jgi:DNA-binding MarR family transcriptional regulator